MEFVKQFNAKTQKDGGILTPVIVNFFSDKSFVFEVKSPPASTLIMKAANLQKGSPESNRTKVGKVTRAQLEEIVEIKKADLNCKSIDSAVSMLRWYGALDGRQRRRIKVSKTVGIDSEGFSSEFSRVQGRCQV